MSALDTQIGGSHYKNMPIQPMEFSMANKLDACQHTIVKYVTRFRDKGGVQDLEKAKHVIDMLIEFETKQAAKAALHPAPGPESETPCDCLACTVVRFTGSDGPPGLSPADILEIIQRLRQAS